MIHCLITGVKSSVVNRVSISGGFRLPCMVVFRIEKAYFIRTAYAISLTKGNHEKRHATMDRIRDTVIGLAEKGYRKILGNLVQKGSRTLDAPIHRSSELQSGHRCIVPVLTPLVVTTLSVTHSLQYCLSQEAQSQCAGWVG